MVQRLPRRIPDRLGSKDYLFEDLPVIGMVQMQDGIVALGPAILVLFVSQNILPESISGVSLIASVLAALAGLALLLFKPTYLSLSEWVGDFLNFRSRVKERSLKFEDEEGDRVDGIEITTEEDTRELTEVRRIYPEQNAIEKRDGTILGMLELTGANLDTADGETWQVTVDSLSNRMNTQLRNKIQFYLPMRQYDPTEEIEMYRNRLDDADVREGNRFLQTYVQDRMQWMEQIGENSYIREYYVVLKVTRNEILENTVNTGGNLNELDQLPGGGVLKDIIVGLRGSKGRALSTRDIRERQFEEISRRKSTVSGILSVGPGNEAEDVSAKNMGVLLKEFWEGIDLRDRESESIVRERRMVVGRSDKERAQQSEDTFNQEDSFLR